MDSPLCLKRTFLRTSTHTLQSEAIEIPTKSKLHCIVQYNKLGELSKVMWCTEGGQRWKGDWGARVSSGISEAFSAEQVRYSECGDNEVGGDRWRWSAWKGEKANIYSTSSSLVSKSQLPRLPLSSITNIKWRLKRGTITFIRSGFRTLILSPLLSIL